MMVRPGMKGMIRLNRPATMTIRTTMNSIIGAMVSMQSPY
jgi:hypothetical protein